MNRQESTKLRHAMRAMILDGIDDEDGQNESEKLKYISDRFNGEMMYPYNARRNRQQVIQDWLQGLALHVPFYHHDVFKFYEYVFNRSLTEKEEETEQNLYWRRLALVVMKMIDQGAK